MKKILKKISIILLSLFVIFVYFYNNKISNAELKIELDNGDVPNIENTAAFADALYHNKDRGILNSDVNEILGSKLIDTPNAIMVYNNVICAYHKQPTKADTDLYYSMHIVNIIDIDGDKMTIHTKDKDTTTIITNNEIAKLAHAVSDTYNAGNGWGVTDGSPNYDKHFSKEKYAIWKLFKSINYEGSIHSDFNTDVKDDNIELDALTAIATNPDGYYYDFNADGFHEGIGGDIHYKYDSSYQEYYNSLQTNTATGSVSKKEDTIPKYDFKNGYLGPFEIDFSGNPEFGKLELNVNDESYEIEKIYYLKKNEQTNETYYEERIALDDENLFEKERAFYIKLPEEVKDTYIKSCNLKLNINKQTTYKARLFLTGGLNGLSQCQMFWIGKPDETEGEITWDIETTANLGVEKVDYDTNLSLKDVGFNIKKDDKYIKIYTIENNQEEEQKQVTGDVLVSNIELVDSKEEATEFITDSNGKFNIFGLYAGNYTLEEVLVPYGYTNKMYWNSNEIEETGNQIEINLSPQPLEETQQIDSNNIVQVAKIRNQKQTGNLKIIKKDNKTGQVLKNIGFKLINSDGKYIKAIDSNGELNNVNGNVVLSNIEYLDDEEQGTEFITNESGEINIFNIPIGEYQVIETSIGNEYNSYEIDPEFIYWNSNETNQDSTLSQAQAVVKVNRQKSDQTDGVGTDDINSLITFKNEKKCIDISGIVWKDLPTSDGKNTIPPDGTYNENTDELFSNENDRIFVYLVDNAGNILKDKNGNDYRQEVIDGSYKFEQVKLSELANCKVKFTYNGFKYENVISDSDVDKELTSKASETEEKREEFNKSFSNVTGDTDNSGMTSGGHDLNYQRRDNEKQISDLIKIDNKNIEGNDYSERIAIEADTTDDYLINRYNYLSNNGTNPISEITYINLGVYKRSMPDLFLDQVLYSTKVSMNDNDTEYEHVYLYENRGINRSNNKVEYTGGFNVGIEFEKRFGGGYSLPIYKSDFDTIYENNNGKKLKANLTYAIKINNLSTGLGAKVHSILDYYDSGYNIVKAGTKIDENTKQISDESMIDNNSIHQESYNDDYSKAIIDLPEEMIESNNSGIIFVEFELNDEALIRKINKNDNKIENVVLRNVVEINSYTIYNGEKVFAGIDKNSNPGNAKPGENNTYENDTAVGQDVKFNVERERIISGTVFEDEATEDNINEKLIEGNGELDGNEKKIQGVKVELFDTNNNKVAEDTTKNEGEYILTGFVPGKYYVKYTWPGENKEYDSKNYKATIFNEESHKVEDRWWTKGNPDSDAKDDYSKREEIDSSVNPINMESKTNIMDIGIEFNDNYEIKSIDELIIDNNKVYIPTFNISNVNFGIIKRPELNLTIDKRVSEFKVTYLNGQVLTDVKIERDEEGKLGPVGTNKGMTYYPEDPNNDKSNPYGMIRQEMDSEFIQGAIMEVKYEIVVKNDSDLDYANEKFYTYGKASGDKSNPVTIDPVALTDYLDEKFDYDPNLGDEDGINEVYWKKVDVYKDDDNFDPRGSTVKTSDTGWNLLETITDEKFDLKRYRRASSDSDEDNISYSYRYQKNIKDSALKEKYRSMRVELKNVGGLEAGDEIRSYLYFKKRLSNSDDLEFNNESEISEYKITNGKIPKIENIKIVDFAEEIVITPSTGGNKNHIEIIILSVSILCILGIGIIFIKKKVIGK